MTGWKRYAVAVAIGLMGAALWGILMSVLDTPGYAVIGAIVIVGCALVWARNE